MIYECPVTPPNFGDALNTWLWPKVFSHPLDSAKDLDIFGIGSVLDSRVNAYAKKHILGSGARSVDHGVIIDDSIEFHAVRGPLTAKALQLSPSKALTDPAILVSKFKSNDSQSKNIGFIPYFRSPHGAWKEVCRMAGLTFISPHLDCDTFLKKVAACEYVMSEALHGAIVADSLRIPWAALQSTSAVLEGDTNNFKWTDWCQSMSLDYLPNQLPIIWHDNEPGKLPLKNRVKNYYIASKVKSIAKKGPWQLSADNTVNSKVQQWSDVINKFENTYF